MVNSKNYSNIYMGQRTIELIKRQFSVACSVVNFQFNGIFNYTEPT